MGSLFLIIIGSLVLDSCEMLQLSLSSEQKIRIVAETGVANLADTVWYYNGSKNSSMAGSVGFLSISFGKKVRLSETGLSGSFTLSYTNGAGNQSTETLSLSGGYLSSDATVYHLNMGPILSRLDGGTTIPSGSLNVTVKVGGFLCDEGDQKGRPIGELERTILVSPLYSVETLSGLSFSTMTSSLGRAIMIPVNGTVTLSEDASLTIEASSGSSLPTGLTSRDFTLSVSNDGKAILVSPLVELYGKEFSMKLTIQGIRTATCHVPMEQTFTVTCQKALIAIDGLQDTNWTSSSVAVFQDTQGDGSAGGWSQSGIDIHTLRVTSDPNYLYVSLAGYLGVNWNDGIVILIDKASANEVGSTNVASVVSTAGAALPAATSSFTNGEPDIYFWHKPGYQDNAGNGAGILFGKSGSSWGKTTEFWRPWSSPSGFSLSPVGWTQSAPPTFVEYAFPLATLGLSSGDTVRVIVVLSSNWSGTAYATDTAPNMSVNDSHNTATFDFAQGLSYTIGETSGTVTFAVPAAPAWVRIRSVSTSSISLSWQSVYGAASYQLLRSSSATGPFTVVASSITNTNYTDTGLSSNSTYYYQVKAVNESGESGTSPTVAGKTN